VNAGRALVPLLQLRERLAQIYLGAGSTVEAVAQYDAILQVARNNLAPRSNMPLPTR